MVKLKKLTLRQNGSFIQLSKEGQRMIIGGTSCPTNPYTPTPYYCPNDKTSVTKPLVLTTYPVTPRQ